MTPAARAPLILLLAASFPAESGAQVSTSPLLGPATAAALGVASDDRAKALLLTDLLLEEGRVGEADEFAASWREKDQVKNVWLLRQARIRTAQGRFEESAALYKLLLEQNPEDAGILLQVGLQDYSAGNLSEARRALLQAHEKSHDPIISYYLAETAFALGREGEGRKWAETALAEMPAKKNLSNERMSLRLRSRLGWSDALDREYQKLFEAHPLEPETLFDWVSALTRAGLDDSAGEPLALLRERFPEQDAKVRLLKADQLSRLGDEAALSDFLAESLARYPEEPSFRYRAGEMDFKARRWEQSRDHFESSVKAENYRKGSLEMLEEIHRQYDHHLGPEFLFKQSEGTVVFGESLRYHGYARRNIRVEATAGRASYNSRRGGASSSRTGLWASVARESGRWAAGMDADIRTGPGFGAFSPGLFGELDLGKTCVLTGAAGFARAWTAAAEGAAVGAKSTSAELKGHCRPTRRLSLGGYGRLDLLSVRNGGKATQTAWTPEAVWTLLDRPFYAALSYRYVAGNASGDAPFFSVLPLLGHYRTHFLTLAASRHWVESKTRAGAYVFNGHDDGRGRSFGTADLVGGGLDFEKQLGRLQLLASYEFNRDDQNGVGGKAHTVRVSTMWRWARKSGLRDQR